MVSSVLACYFCFCFFFKQKTAYEMRISDWSSDVCSSDLITISLYLYYSIWHVNASKGSAAHGPPAISHESRRRADTAQAAGALRARRPHGHRPRAHSRAEPAAAVASPEAARRGRPARPQSRGELGLLPAGPPWRSEERRVGKGWVR